MILPPIKIPWKVLAFAGVMLVLCWKCYDLGQDHKQEQWDKAVKRGQVIVDRLKSEQGKITVKTEVRYVDRVKIIKEKGEERVKVVTKFIPAGTPDLPSGFRLLHDSAAAGTFPGTAEGGSPVPVRTVAETVSRNYDVCHQWKAALDEQVLWARRQRELYLSECKRQGLNCN